MIRALAMTANAFPLWIVLGCVWAWFQPPAWTWFRPWIEPGLGMIMLGMGLTLRWADFLAVLRVPRHVLVGVAAQFTIMPLAGWAIAKGFGLEAGLAIGLILVACCPGGTASNVICYLAKANVPLSVLMTMTSTVVAIFATPLLTKWLAGAWLPVDAWALFKSMLMVVLLPLVCGIGINTLLGKLKDPVRARMWIGAVGPVLSVVVIVLIVSCVVALKKDAIAGSALPLFVSVLLLHACGFGLGYGFAALSGCAEPLRRTISIEVGMQNSGLGAALASKHFAHLALAPVPAAISAVYHCLIGSLLAWWWGRNGFTATADARRAKAVKKTPSSPRWRTPRGKWVTYPRCFLMTLGLIFFGVPLALACHQWSAVVDGPMWSWLLLAVFCLFGLFLLAVGVFGSREWSDAWGKHTSNCGGNLGLELLVMLIAAPLYFTLKAFERK